MEFVTIIRNRWKNNQQEETAVNKGRNQKNLECNRFYSRGMDIRNPLGCRGSMVGVGGTYRFS